MNKEELLKAVENTQGDEMKKMNTYLIHASERVHYAIEIQAESIADAQHIAEETKYDFQWEAYDAEDLTIDDITLSALHSQDIGISQMEDV